MENKSPIIYGDRKQTRNFVYVDDLVEANLCALRKENFGCQVFNVCSGKPSSVNNLFEILSKGSDKSGVFPGYTKSRVEAVKKRYCDTSKSSKELGLKQRLIWKRE